ncbi:MAG: helix-turn-helix domain-containing protein [Candidatus Omnitrophica bacterium]|nr:helix-turn-helix domain-containing protein [Candidatus Omnitrophota bacterium]
MTIGEKIKKLREKRGLSRRDLLGEIIQIFGDKSLTYLTLSRIEKGESDGRGSSLHQICQALNVSLRDLKHGTKEDPALMECIRNYAYKGKYIYNEKAFAEILSGRQHRFLALQLILHSKGKTKTEQDPKTDEDYRKWIFIIKGTISCHVDNKEILLRKGDTFSFISYLPHYFENKTSQKATCIIIQDPRHI